MDKLEIILVCITIIGLTLFLFYKLLKIEDKRVKSMVLQKGDKVRFSYSQSLKGVVLDGENQMVIIKVKIPKHLIYKEDE